VGIDTSPEELLAYLRAQADEKTPWLLYYVPIPLLSNFIEWKVKIIFNFFDIKSLFYINIIFGGTVALIILLILMCPHTYAGVVRGRLPV
jgi:hypothetical protein